MIRRITCTRFGLVMAAVAGLGLVGGCGPSGGALLYHLGVGGKQMVKAEFLLGPGPVLTLVDDFNERLNWPEVRDLLADSLADELLDHETTEKIISNEDIRRMRRARPDFDARGCREVGEMLGAKQVVWLQVTDFFASEEIEDTTSAAWLAVTVKVIDVRATRRQDVRLWPREREGYPLRAELSSNEVSRAKQRRAIAKALAAKVARETARLFYNHVLADVETL